MADSDTIDMNVNKILIFMGIILLVSTLINLIYFFYPDYDYINNDYEIGYDEIGHDEIGHDSQYYSGEGYNEVIKPTMRWKNSLINYSYGKDCVGPILPRIEESFQIIEDETRGVIRFIKVDNTPDIKIRCYEHQNIDTDYIVTTYYTQGEATPTTTGNNIDSFLIEFWGVSEDSRPESCWNFPKLELHEIIHTFGFGHVTNNRFSLMHPSENRCMARSDNVSIDGGKTHFIPEDKIDDKIISDLIEIYG